MLPVFPVQEEQALEQFKVLLPPAPLQINCPDTNWHLLSACSCFQGAPNKLTLKQGREQLGESWCLETEQQSTELGKTELQTTPNASERRELNCGEN